MAARAHRKGFSPLPADGWYEDRDGPWEAYIERCVHEGARVYDVYKYGYRIVWQNNDDRRLHRIDGPAIEVQNGHKEWWYNGRLHRLDGPAIERTNGTVQFWKEGVMYTDITFTRRY